MQKQMTFLLSEVLGDLIRLHAKHTDWDEPDVHYLQRKLNGKPRAIPPHPGDHHEVVFEFGNIEVAIRAVEEHVEIVLRYRPPGMALAA